MKKVIFLIFIISFTFVGQNVFACSTVSGVKYPTVKSVLSKDDTAIGLYKITSAGQKATAKLIIGNENTSMNVDFETDTSSCGLKSDDFVIGEYIVAVFPKGARIINYSDLDNQFTFDFNIHESAKIKYIELVNLWNKREVSIGELSDNGDLLYVSIGRSLKQGMKNDNVLALQTALKVRLNLGDDFKLDGSYGPATISAVKQFQVSEDLEDDGIAGVLTQGKLVGAVIGTSQNGGSQNKEDKIEKVEEVISGTGYKTVDYSLKQGMKNDNVLALQTALKVRLNLGDDFKLDGSYGPATISAVKQFQVSEDLEDDGIAGDITQAKLVGTTFTTNESGKGNQNNEQTSQDEENNTNDVSDAELKRILIRAKNEIIYYAVGGKNYTDAYELVSGYNNNFLNIYSDSDPLYKSSGGGLYFVYSLKLNNGEYICADNNYQKEITQKKERPNTNTDRVSC